MSKKPFIVKQYIDAAPVWTGNSWLRIRADGYEAHETGCKLLSAAPVAKRGDYLVKFQCSGEGQTWNVNHWMSVRRQQLFIEEVQQEP